MGSMQKNCESPLFFVRGHATLICGSTISRTSKEGDAVENAIKTAQSTVPVTRFHFSLVTGFPKGSKPTRSTKWLKRGNRQPNSPNNLENLMSVTASGGPNQPKTHRHLKQRIKNSDALPRCASKMPHGQFGVLGDSPTSTTTTTQTLTPKKYFDIYSPNSTKSEGNSQAAKNEIRHSASTEQGSTRWR